MLLLLEKMLSSNSLFLVVIITLCSVMSVYGTECVVGSMVYTTIPGRDPSLFMGGNIPQEVDSLCGNQCAPSGTCEFDTCVNCCIKNACMSSLTTECNVNGQYWSNMNTTHCIDKKMLDYCYLKDNSGIYCSKFDTNNTSNLLSSYFIMTSFVLFLVL